MARKEVTFSRRLLGLTMCVGLVAGAVFPPVATFLVGPAALGLPFVLACVIMGLSVGLTLYFSIRASLTRQLSRHLDLLQPLAGEIGRADQSMEGLEASLIRAIDEIRDHIAELVDLVNTFLPHYQRLVGASAFLSTRTQDGLRAARETRGNIVALEEKQRKIAGEMELISHRSHDEAAISRQLSASLQEMADAMDRSNARFLETTATVDEMAGSVRQVASEAERIARSVEESGQDLEGVGESMARIRHEAEHGAAATLAVRADAEDGLRVVDAAIGEMERIASEGEKARIAMQRLAAQAEEVGKIIRVIRELVSDTELLAFNAAIIAAQAGEEGRGFSVVAEEIGDLADRTKTSAQEIARIIQTITTETEEVTAAVEATGERIEQGKAQSRFAGSALRKIVTSAGEAEAATAAIVRVTDEQVTRTRALVEGAGQSLRSVRAIARAIQEQQLAIDRIQHGVADMKSASDLFANGMDEQLRAKRAFDQGLMERGAQIVAINEAIRFQLDVTEKVMAHFASAEDRLNGNAQRTAIIDQESVALEEIARGLNRLADRYHDLRLRRR